MLTFHWRRRLFGSASILIFRFCPICFNMYLLPSFVFLETLDLVQYGVYSSFVAAQSGSGPIQRFTSFG